MSGCPATANTARVALRGGDAGQGVDVPGCPATANTRNVRGLARRHVPAVGQWHIVVGGMGQQGQGDDLPMTRGGLRDDNDRPGARLGGAKLPGADVAAPSDQEALPHLTPAAVIDHASDNIHKWAIVRGTPCHVPCHVCRASCLRTLLNVRPLETITAARRVLLSIGATTTSTNYFSPVNRSPDVVTKPYFHQHVCPAGHEAFQAAGTMA